MVRNGKNLWLFHLAQTARCCAALGYFCAKIGEIEIGRLSFMMSPKVISTYKRFAKSKQARRRKKISDVWNSVSGLTEMVDNIISKAANMFPGNYMKEKGKF